MGLPPSAPGASRTLSPRWRTYGPSTMTVASSAVADPLAAARNALERAAWSEARGRYAAIAEADDDPHAWEGLAWASWWSDDEQATFAAREGAYRAFRSARDARGAARQAAWLSSDVLDFRGDHAVAAGWLERARDLLRDEPRSPEHGWVAVMESHFALKVDEDAAEAAARARDAAAVGRDLAVADLEALGLALEGLALVGRGRLAEGMRRLDVAGALAGVEDFELAVTPTWVMCILISACEGVGDFARAAQWCSAMRVMGERLGGRPTLGVCRTAYGRVLATRGEWRAAERELVAAVGDLAASRPGLAAPRPRRGWASCAPARDEATRRASSSSGGCPHAGAVLGLGALALRRRRRRRRRRGGRARAAPHAARRRPRTHPGAQELLVRAPRWPLGDAGGRRRRLRRAGRRRRPSSGRRTSTAAPARRRRARRRAGPAARTRAAPPRMPSTASRPAPRPTRPRARAPCWPAS